MKKISVIIPVYYNEKFLSLFFKRILEAESKLNQKGVILELIFVDDGSGDQSMNELLKIKLLREQTKIIKLTRNFGAVHALKTGCQLATGDCFMMLAADLQDPPELIEQMVDRWIKGAKYVVCVRKSREDPFFSKVFSYFYYKLIRLLVIPNYPSGGFDMALMDKALLPFFKNSSKNLYAPVLGYWLGYEPDIIYYHRQKRLYGKSRWSFYNKFNTFLDVILGYSVIPLRFLSLSGVLVSTFSFLYGANMIVDGILRRTGVPGFAAIVVIISFLMGIIISSLGIIGEYLWRISEEVNKRPEAVIEKIY